MSWRSPGRYLRLYLKIWREEKLFRLITSSEGIEIFQNSRGPVEADNLNHHMGFIYDPGYKWTKTT